jgi:hypothetical protein
MVIRPRRRSLGSAWIAGLGGAAVNVHLNAHLQSGHAGRALVIQALRRLQPLDGVRPVKVLCHQACLVALDRTNAMPLQGQVRQRGHLVHGLLDVVLAKRALARSVGRTHRIGTKGFGHGQQRDHIGWTATGRAGLCNTAAHALEIVGNHGHNRASVPNNIKRERTLWISPNCWPLVSKTKHRTFTSRPACRP